MDSRKYFSEVSLQRQRLETQFPAGYCFIISVANLDKNVTEGSVSEVSTRIAAKMLVENTHRLLTSDEMVALESAQIAQRKQIATDERANLKARINHLLGAK